MPLKLTVVASEGGELAFTALKNDRSYRFLIERNLMETLADYDPRESSEPLNVLEVFEDFEDQICKVAEKLINLGPETGYTIILTVENFYSQN